MEERRFVDVDFDKAFAPAVFSELVGADYLAGPLRNLMSRRNPGNLAFVAPNGYGKTTVARIFLKTILCEQPNGLDACGVCPNCQETWFELNLETNFYYTSGTQLGQELPRLHNRSRMQYPGRTLDHVGLLVDDLDGASEPDLVRLKDLMEQWRCSPYIVTVTFMGKLPNPLKQRFKVIPIRKWGRGEGHALIRRVAEAQGITVQDEKAVDIVLQATDFNPRLILRTLEQIHIGGGVLSIEALQSTLALEALAVQRGVNPFSAASPGRTDESDDD